MKKMNIPVAAPDLKGNELKYVTECIKTGWVSSNGKFVPLFEERFAHFIHKKFGIATSSGTTAIHLALIAAGVKKGDEVIVPDLTFVATANAVLYTGAKPVFVDSEYSTWCLDPGQIEKKINKNTKAIIPVHLYGHPADMGAIMSLAKKYHLKVIEDAAEAHGSLIMNKPVGGFGDIGCFSFFGNKTITTGEGGMVVTDDEEIARKVRFLRDGGRDRSKNVYYHTVLGYNYALTNMQAAVGVAQLERIKQFILLKRKIAGIYRRELGDVDVLELSPEKSGVKSIFWMFSIVLREWARISRDQLIGELKLRGIETRPFFHPMHDIPYMRIDEEFPVAEYLARNGLNLPSGTKLSEEEVVFVARNIKEILSTKG